MFFLQTLTLGEVNAQNPLKIQGWPKIGRPGPRSSDKDHGTRMSTDGSALQLLLTGDPGLFAIVRLSLLVSLSAVFLAAVIGVPAGALLALTRFRGREAAIVI